MIYPPLAEKLSSTNLPLEDHTGAHYTLDSALSSFGELTLLIPGFTKCYGVCPALAHMYKALLKDPQVSHLRSQISILFLSFDTSDTVQDLQHFQKKHTLPPEWKIVRTTPEHTQALLKELSYTVMKTPAGFEHPAQAFLFSKEGFWMGSLYGKDVTASELVKAVDQAVFQEEYPLLYKAQQTLSSPNVLASIAGGFFLVSLVFALWLGIRISAKKKKLARSAGAHADADV